MADPFFRRFVVSSRVAIDEVVAFIETYWEAALAEGDAIQVEVSEQIVDRSDEANAYYWASIVNQISEQAWVKTPTGLEVQYPARAWHEELKERFAPRVDRPFGPSVPMSTTRMNRKQFFKYVHECEAWAAGPPLNVRFVERREPPPWLAHKQ